MRVDARTALARQGEPGEKNVPVSDCSAVNKLPESVLCVTCKKIRDSAAAGWKCRPGGGPSSPHGGGQVAFVFDG